MRVDHGRGNVAVAEELLDGADVVAALEEVRGEGMTERVAGAALVECLRRAHHRRVPLPVKENETPNSRYIRFFRYACERRARRFEVRSYSPQRH